MPNVKTIISGHNKKVLKSYREPTATTQVRTCNCRGGAANCPLNGECLAECIIYQATVTTTPDGEVKTYTGLTDNKFKERYGSHKSSFNHENQKDSTALSQYIWQLKHSQKSFNIKWEIVKRCQSYKCGGKSCDLCTTEKVFILRSDPQTSLNKRSELVSKCRHRRKFKLEAVT